ncbi:hypothetical protein F8388_006153 [Cannabis sativa]|uniref:Reverse transcriptase zinc-binding domain-containing protein n=1 Tax=Cannabis sativa TaxID=3483 RepID=A0A7J6G7C0_CANSA|nr:hypothetical protein F8388_006153 [Cannabis sativa]
MVNNHDIIEAEELNRTPRSRSQSWAEEVGEELMKAGEHQQSPNSSYYNFWAEHPEFKEVVLESWQKSIRGEGMTCLYLKLMQLKHAIKKFNRGTIGDIGKKYHEARDNYLEARLQAQTHALDPIYQQVEKETATAFNNQDKMYHSFLRQRSKVTWLCKGDENNAFFHAFLKKRRMENSIVSYTNEQGEIVDDFKEVARHFIKHFQDIRKTGAGANHFKTKLLYNNSIAQEQFGSNKVIWSSLNMPKHRFIFWQAINDQLLTRDKFAKFQIALDTTLCPVMAQVCNWLKTCCWPTGFLNWQQWLCLNSKDKRQRVHVTILAAMIYSLWSNRNNCIFNNFSNTAVKITKDIKNIVYLRLQIAKKGSLKDYEKRYIERLYM